MPKRRDINSDFREAIATVHHYIVRLIIIRIRKVANLLWKRLPSKIHLQGQTRVRAAAKKNMSPSVNIVCVHDSTTEKRPT